jgi:hypothetical protein
MTTGGHSRVVYFAVDVELAKGARRAGLSTQANEKVRQSNRLEKRHDLKQYHNAEEKAVDLRNAEDH